MTLTLITSQPQLSSGAVPRSIQCTLCYNHGHVINYWADRCILHHFYPTSYLEPHLKPLLKLWSFDGIEVHLFVVIIMIIIIATTIKSGQRIKMKGVIIVLSPIAAANAFLWPWPHLINGCLGPHEAAATRHSDWFSRFLHGSWTWPSETWTDGHTHRPTTLLLM